MRRPESVLVIICTSAREVLLLHRVAPYSFWQSVTGALEWDEDPMTTAIREVSEETGIDMPDRIEDLDLRYRFTIDPRWRHRYSAEDDENLEHVFRLELPERVPVVLSLGEHDDSAWFSWEEATDRVWSWTNRAALEYLA